MHATSTCAPRIGRSHVVNILNRLSPKNVQAKAKCDDEDLPRGALEDTGSDDNDESTETMLTRRSTRQSQRTQDEDAPLDSIQEGDTNYLDLASSFVGNDDLSLTQLQTQPPVPLYPESQRFAKTPATAGRKRDSRGNVVDTPVVSRNPFATRTPGLPIGLSQAFENTQAVSSPFGNAVAAELRSDLPSPGIMLERRVQYATSSSPMKPLSAYKKAGVEPSSRYIPSSESQLQNEDEDFSQKSDDLDWDGDVGRLVREQKKKEKELRAKAQLKAASSPISSPAKNKGQQSPPSSPPRVSDQIIPDDEDCDLDPTQTQYIESNPSGLVPVPIEDMAGYDTDPITIPETSIRPTPTLQHTQLTQPSPSMRQSKANRTAACLDPTGKARVRIANSQKSRPSTQDLANGLPKISSLESIELVPASPEYSDEVQGRTPGSPLKQRKNASRSSPNPARNGLVEVRQTSARQVAHGHTQQRDTVPASTVPETSSAAQNSRPTQEPAKFSSAVEIQPPSSSKDAIHSSQPIHVPERRKRKRMEDISQEDSVPPATQISSFDVLEDLLALDNDPEAAGFLASSPKQPVSNQKRVKLNDKRSQELATAKATVNPISTRMPLLKPTVQETVQRAQVNGVEQAEAAAEVEMEDAPGGPSDDDTPGDAEDNAEKGPIVGSTTPERRPKKASKWDLGDSPKARFVIDRPRARIQPPPETLRQAAAKRSRQKKDVTDSEILVTPSAAKSSVTEAPSTNTTVTAQSTLSDTDLEIVASNMVLAHFYDGKSKYYPARYIEPGDGDKVLIQWPGYDPELVPSHSICSFSLRVGDEVKVEMNGFPKIHFVVEGLRKEQQEANEDTITDVYGNSHVLLKSKSAKASYPKGYSAQTPIPIGSISIDMSQWRRTSKRPNVFLTKSEVLTDIASAYSTPPPRTETPVTPSSRSRNALKKELMPPPPIRKPGIFSNMAFTLSYTDDEARQRYAKLIDENGGALLQQGFQELFDDSQNLKSEFAKFGFTASLSNSHAAKAKHLQALALGLPCLSGKWVEASLSSGILEPWEDYLLPAGESLDLDRAVKSRVLKLPEFEQFRLSEVLEERRSHFEGSLVLFTKRKSDKERPYLFLAQAMSSVQVEEVTDAKTAKSRIAELGEPGTVWLLVEKGGASAAESIVKGLVQKNNTKKRRSKDPVDDLKDLDIRVVDSETIKQTLIMGRLSMHNQQ